MAEVRGQRIENRGQNTEDRGQRTEGRRSLVAIRIMVQQVVESSVKIDDNRRRRCGN